MAFYYSFKPALSSNTLILNPWTCWDQEWPCLINSQDASRVIIQIHCRSKLIFSVDLVGSQLSFLAHLRMYNRHSSTPCPKIQQWYLLSSSLSYPICPTRSSQYQVPKTTIVIQHTSYLYARNPIKAGKANMYANVILAVRAFHLKYLCLLWMASITALSVFSLSHSPYWRGEGGGRTVVFQQRWVEIEV